MPRSGGGAPGAARQRGAVGNKQRAPSTGPRINLTGGGAPALQIHVKGGSPTFTAPSDAGLGPSAPMQYSAAAVQQLGGWGSSAGNLGNGGPAGGTLANGGLSAGGNQSEVPYGMAAMHSIPASLARVSTGGATLQEGNLAPLAGMQQWPAHALSQPPVNPYLYGGVRAPHPPIYTHTPGHVPH